MIEGLTWDWAWIISVIGEERLDKAKDRRLVAVKAAHLVEVDHVEAHAEACASHDKLDIPTIIICHPMDPREHFAHTRNNLFQAIHLAIVEVSVQSGVVLNI